MPEPGFSNGMLDLTSISASSGASIFEFQEHLLKEIAAGLALPAKFFQTPPADFWDEPSWWRCFESPFNDQTERPAEHPDGG